MILFNTCSVRQHAEDKIYSALGRIRIHMDENPHKILGVLGCMAQKDQELILRRAPMLMSFVVRGSWVGLLNLLKMQNHQANLN